MIQHAEVNHGLLILSLSFLTSGKNLKVDILLGIKIKTIDVNKKMRNFDKLKREIILRTIACKWLVCFLISTPQ